MLNNKSITEIKKLLDDYSVYKYEDDVTVEIIDEEEVTTVTKTAESKFEDDIEACCDEVYIDELSKFISETSYTDLKALSYDNYTLNEKRIYLAEIYFTASKFLEKFSLRNETENFKTTFDYSTKTSVSEKSGKLYSSKRYYDIGRSYLTELETYFKNPSIFKIGRH